MKRIEELDFARVIAMTTVITIHVTSTYIGYRSNILVMGMNLAFILNQLARFSVPLFILLSGVSLRLSASDDSFSNFFHGQKLYHDSQMKYQNNHIQTERH